MAEGYRQLNEEFIEETAKAVEAEFRRAQTSPNTGKIIHPEGTRVLPERLGQPMDNNRKKQEVKGDQLG